MFDLSSIKSTNTEDTLLPDAKYNVVCSDAVLKDTKAGTGQYIAATFTIKTGEHKGRQIREIFNVENPNPMAVKIGMAGIRGLFESSNYAGNYKFETPNDAAVEMFGLLVGVETKTQESKDPEFGPQVRVKKYFKLTGGTSATTTPATTQASPSTAPQQTDEIPF